MAGVVQAIRIAPTKGKWEKTRQDRFQKGQISGGFNPPKHKPKRKK